MNKPVDPAIEETQGPHARRFWSCRSARNADKGRPSAALRKDRLTRCIDMLMTHKDDIVGGAQTPTSAPGRPT